ncbi:hypothetical protein V6N13_109776 [Hibiscus sabdariffa]
MSLTCKRTLHRARYHRPPPDPDTIQHRTISSSWAHSAVHGIIVVACSSPLGTNKSRKGWNCQVLGHRRGRSLKLDFHLATIMVLDGTPSLTITTNSYHFCKLSLVKKPIANTKQGNETVGKELPSDSRGKTTKDQEKCSNTSEDHFQGGLIEETSVEGLKYVAMAGEHSSEVELWDLNTSERTIRLPQYNSVDSSSFSTKQRA